MAVPGTPEFDFGMRFKELYDNEMRSRDQLDKTLKEAKERLESEMEQFKHHEHANVLRLRKFIKVCSILSIPDTLVPNNTLAPDYEPVLISEVH